MTKPDSRESLWNDTVISVRGSVVHGHFPSYLPDLKETILPVIIDSTAVFEIVGPTVTR